MPDRRANKRLKILHKLSFSLAACPRSEITDVACRETGSFKRNGITQGAVREVDGSLEKRFALILPRILLRICHSL